MQDRGGGGGDSGPRIVLLGQVGKIATQTNANKLQENRTTDKSQRFLWDLSEIDERSYVGKKKTASIFSNGMPMEYGLCGCAYARLCLYLRVFGTQPPSE